MRLGRFRIVESIYRGSFFKDTTAFTCEEFVIESVAYLLAFLPMSWFKYLVISLINLRLPMQGKY